MQVVNNIGWVQDNQRYVAESQMTGQSILSGRHRLHIIYQGCARCEGSGAAYTLADLTRLVLRNDQGLGSRYNAWATQR